MASEVTLANVTIFGGDVCCAAPQTTRRIGHTAALRSLLQGLCPGKEAQTWMIDRTPHKRNFAGRSSTAKNGSAKCHKRVSDARSRIRGETL